MLELFSIFILSPIYGISKFIEYAMPVPIINIINEEGIFFTDLNLTTDTGAHVFIGGKNGLLTTPNITQSSDNSKTTVDINLSALNLESFLSKGIKTNC